MSRATQLHHEAMEFCDQAFAARRAADEEQAQVLFRKAFERERDAAESFRDKPDVEPTRSVLYRSAATLALDCGDLNSADALIRVGLAGNPPAEIAHELLGLQQEVRLTLPKKSTKHSGGQALSQGFLKAAQSAAIFLKHVSDPNRLQILMMLSEGERDVGTLCSQIGQSQPAVSHHLALLRRGGIVIPRRQGKYSYYSLTDSGRELAKIFKRLSAERNFFEDSTARRAGRTSVRV